VRRNWREVFSTLNYCVGEEFRHSLEDKVRGSTAGPSFSPLCRSGRVGRAPITRSFRSGETFRALSKKLPGKYFLQTCHETQPREESVLQMFHCVLPRDCSIGGLQGLTLLSSDYQIPYHQKSAQYCATPEESLRRARSLTRSLQFRISFS
jgi:hypothetical protein